MAFNSPEEEWSARLRLELNDRLFAAAAEANIDKIKQLLKEGADVNADRGKVLRLAAGMGHADIVALFLHHKADVAPLDNAALRQAVKGGYQSIAGMLLGHGADPNAGEGEALIDAAERGRTEMVNLLLSYGADPGASEDQALRKAAYNGHLDVVQALVRHGADVFAMHGSALTLAQADKHIPVVEYLAHVMHGQREYFRDVFATAKPEDLPGLLRASWQDVNGRDTGEPALVRAIKMNCLADVLEPLKRAGAGLAAQDLFDLRDREGRRFVQIAAERARLAKIFDTDLWPGRFDEMAACWEKLTPAQRRQGGMKPEDFAHLVARQKQAQLRARAGGMKLRLRDAGNAPKPPGI